MTSHAHIPHPHSSSHKAAGYAFALNLCRSLGLWWSQAPFPSDVQKPTYLCLNANDGTVDWSELLRKYSKHNVNRQSHIKAASAKLELVVWRAVESRTGSSKYLELQKRRIDRRRRLVKHGQPGEAGPAGDAGDHAYLSLPPPPDDLLVRHASDQNNIEEALQALRGLLSASDQGSIVHESRIVVALASFTLARFSDCLQHLPAEGASFSTQGDTASHDLDLQVLSIVLRGMAIEQLALRAENPQEEFQRAVATYRSLPLNPPPPIPEAQRYVELGLGRLALLGWPSTMQAAREHLSTTSAFKTVPAGKRLLTYRSYLSGLLDEVESASNSDNEDSPDTTDVLRTFRAYEDLLHNNHSLARFPRAGEVTTNMTEYMDLLFAFWDLGVLPGKFAVDSLYRALTKTYASQKLHRYLVIICSTLSFIESDRSKGKAHGNEAMRNLRLYVALFEKSRETDQQAVTQELRQYRKKHDGDISSEEESDDGRRPAGTTAAKRNDVERDEDFCRVACIGARLLLRESTLDGKQEQGDERLALIEEALDLIEKGNKVLGKEKSRERAKDKITGQDGSDKPLSSGRVEDQSLCKEKSAIAAEVHMWLGIARAEWALAEADAEQSRGRAQAAIAQLRKAIDFLPSVSATSALTADVRIMPRQAYHSTRALRTRVLYSLAYAQLEARDVSSAISTAKQAVDSISGPLVSDETSSKSFTLSDSMKVWHLFVLALTARKDWTRAQEVTDLALYGDTADSDILNEEGTSVHNDDARSPTSPTSPSAIKPLSDEDAPRPEGPRRQMTRADAPYDPSATGRSGDAPQIVKSSSPPETDSSGRTGEDSSSSFVKVRLPVHTPENDNRNGNGSRSRTRSPSIAASYQGSTAGKFTERRTEPMTLRTTSPWDDLEAEIDFMITRNKCIEAVEGPEIALQDLQANVFTRFSKKRDDLEQITDPRSAEDAYSTSPRTAAATYPYPSSAASDGRRLAQALDDFNADQSKQPHGRARSILGSISLRHRSRTNSVRHDRSGTVGTTASRLTVPDQTRPRSASGSSNRSNADPSMIEAASTHGRQNESASLSGAPATSGGPAKPLQIQTARVLSKLWLASAATFRRWGKLDECLGAISEAEDVAGHFDPEVWLQYALYLRASAPDTDDRILLAFSKSLAISADHVPTCLTISKQHLDWGNWAISEGFLDTATQTNAWDSPEAWYLLAKVYENTRRKPRAKECLLYALELETTRPIRELRATLPRFI